jgi:hypothetical protein
VDTTAKTILDGAFALAHRAQTSRILDRLQARMDALTRALRTHPAPNRKPLLLEDLRGTRDEWDRIIDQAIAA